MSKFFGLSCIESGSSEIRQSWIFFPSWQICSSIFESFPFPKHLDFWWPSSPRLDSDEWKKHSSLHLCRSRIKAPLPWSLLQNRNMSSHVPPFRGPTVLYQKEQFWCRLLVAVVVVYGDCCLVLLFGGARRRILRLWRKESAFQEEPSGKARKVTVQLKKGWTSGAIKWALEFKWRAFCFVIIIRWE